jgi:transcriptional regulator with XRE-family HTH domain
MNSRLFGKQLKSIRKERGVAPEELAKVLEVNVGTIGQIESGRRLTTIGNLVKICNHLKISPEYLLALELEDKFENFDSNYIKLCNLILELNPGEFNQFYDFIELVVRNRERYR